MTSKLVVNTIEADTGISSVSFASSISMNSTAKFHFSAAGVDIGADTNINRPAAGVLGFNISGSEKVRIKSDGNVGIGTDNPTNKLSVCNGGIKVFGAATPNINFSPVHGNSGNADISFDASDLKIISNSSSANVRIGAYSKLTHFVIRPNGRIGVGTDSPSNSSLLHLYSTTADPYLRIGSGTRDCGITLHPNSAFNVLRSDAANRLYVNAGADSIRFSVGGDSSTYEKLRIESDGDIGLATASPNATGFGSPVVSIGKSGNPYAVLELQGTQPNDGAAGVLVCHNSSGSSRLAELAFNREGANNTGSLSINTYGAGSAGEVARFNASKQLLLGATANKTINSHAPRLQVQGTNYSGSTVSIINNANDTTGAYLFFGKQRSGAVGGNTAVQAGDMIGELRFSAGDGTDMDGYTARIIVSADANASSNNTSGRIDFHTTRQNGSPHFKLRIGQNSSHGTQFSFGTETSDLNNSSTPDRTSLKVGPATHIEGVFGHNGTPGMYYNCYSGGNDNFYRGTRAPSGGDWRPCAYGQKYGGHYFYGDPSNTAYSAQAQITTMQTNMSISREGYVLKPKNPVFDAVRTSGQLSGNGDLIVFNSAMTNVGGHYSTSTGRFTAPVAGTYFFSMFGMWNSGLAWYNFRKNGIVISPAHGTYQTNGSDWSSVGMSICITLAANDTMAAHLAPTSTGIYGGGNNHNGFCGYLIG